jgi:sirohydrochlorin ferrochelatase
MKAVLLIAHGSRIKEGKQEILALTEILRETLKGKYDRVSSAFLERETPSVPTIIQDYINTGITHILIIPYLLATGTHVVRDIPDMVEAFRKQYPKVDIYVAPHIGKSMKMPGLICDHLEELERIS